MFIIYIFWCMRLFLFMICVYCYGKLIKWFSLCCEFGTVFRSLNILLFWGKYWSESLYFKHVMTYEKYFVYIGTMLYFVYFYSQFYCQFLMSLTIRLFLSLKCVLLRWIYSIMTTLCNLDQYVEVQILLLNISWLILNSSYLCFDLFIGSHLLIIII